MQNKANIKDTDLRIRAMLKAEDKGAPRNPWFVRKTLNRLPEQRRRRLVSLPELTAFLLVMIASVTIIAVELHKGFGTNPPTFNATLLLMASLSALTATLYIAVPILRRS